MTTTTHPVDSTTRPCCDGIGRHTDECTTNADDTATTGPCECERLYGLDRAEDIHDLFKRLHGAVYHVPAARA
jgi:hypothetical protein